MDDKEEAAIRALFAGFEETIEKRRVLMDEVRKGWRAPQRKGGTATRETHCYRCQGDLNNADNRYCPKCQGLVCDKCDWCLCGTQWARKPPDHGLGGFWRE